MSPLILAGWLACQTFDSVSTEVAISHGAQEVGPVMRYLNRPGRIGLKIGINIALLKRQRHIESKGLRWVFPVAMIGEGCMASIWNMRNR